MLLQFFGLLGMIIEYLLNKRNLLFVEFTVDCGKMQTLNGRCVLLRLIPLGGSIVL